MWSWHKKMLQLQEELINQQSRDFIVLVPELLTVIELLVFNLILIIQRQLLVMWMEQDNRYFNKIFRLF